MWETITQEFDSIWYDKLFELQNLNIIQRKSKKLISN